MKLVFILFDSLNRHLLSPYGGQINTQHMLAAIKEAGERKLQQMTTNRDRPHISEELGWLLMQGNAMGTCSSLD